MSNIFVLFGATSLTLVKVLTGLKIADISQLRLENSASTYAIPKAVGDVF